MRCKAKSMGLLFVTAFFLCFMLLFFKPSVAHAAVDATDLSYNMVNHNCTANLTGFRADGTNHWQVCKICGKHVNVMNHNIQNQTWRTKLRVLVDKSTGATVQAYGTNGTSGVLVPLYSCAPNNEGEIGCTCGVNGMRHVTNYDNQYIKHGYSNVYLQMYDGSLIPFVGSGLLGSDDHSGGIQNPKQYGDHYAFMDHNDEYHVWKCPLCRAEMTSSIYKSMYGQVHHQLGVACFCGGTLSNRNTSYFVYLYGSDPSKYANEDFNASYSGDNCSYMIRAVTGWNPVSNISVSQYDQNSDGSFDVTFSVILNESGFGGNGDRNMQDIDSGQFNTNCNISLSGNVCTVSVHVGSDRVDELPGGQLRLSVPGLVKGSDLLGGYLIVNTDNIAYAQKAGRANEVTPRVDGTFVSQCNDPNGYYNESNKSADNILWKAEKSVYVSASDNQSHYLTFTLNVAQPGGPVFYSVTRSVETVPENGRRVVRCAEFKIPCEVETDQLVYSVYVADGSDPNSHSDWSSGSIYKLDPVTPQVASWCISNGQQVNGYVDNGEVVQSVADGWSKTKTYGSLYGDAGSGVYRFGIVMQNIYGLTPSQIGSSGSVKFFEMSHDLKDQNRPWYGYPTYNDIGSAVIFNGDVYADKDIALMTVDGTGLSCVSRLRLSKIDNTAPTIGIDDIAISEGVDGATVTVHADDINQKLYNRYKSDASLKSQYPDGTSYYVGSGRDGYYFGYSKNSNKTNIKWNTTVYDNDITINDGGYYYVYAKDLAGNISEGKQVWVPIWNKVIFDARGGDGDRGTTDGYFTNASGANIGRYITRWYQWDTTYKDYPATTNGTKPSGNASFPVPTRVGYTFIGWFKTPQTVTATHIDASHTSYNSDTSVSGKLATNGSIPHEHTTTLYAHWKANTFTVSFDSNAQNGAGTVTGTMNPMTFTVDIWQKLTPNAFSKVTTGHVVCKNGQLVAIDSAFKGWDRDPMVIRVGNTTPTYADKAYVRNLTYTNNDRVTLYAIWDDSPRFYKDGNGYVHNEYPDRQFSLSDAQAGRITEEELLRTVVVYDRESNPMRNKTSADVAATGDMGVTLFNYSADEFTTLTQPANISITYKAKDESNTCAYYTITVYVTSNDANASEIRDFVRNISSKYQTLAPEDGGLSSDSWWRTNDFYHSQLESALNGSDTTYEHTFSSDDLNNIREYVERNGFGNAEHDDALQNLYDQYR